MAAIYFQGGECICVEETHEEIEKKSHRYASTMPVYVTLHDSAAPHEEIQVNMNLVTYIK